jgi:hypothetical protein
MNWLVCICMCSREHPEQRNVCNVSIQLAAEANLAAQVGPICNPCAEAQGLKLQVGDTVTLEGKIVWIGGGQAQIEIQSADGVDDEGVWMRLSVLPGKSSTDARLEEPP